MIARLKWNDGMEAMLNDDLTWTVTPDAPEVAEMIRGIFEREQIGLGPANGFPELVATKRIVEILEPDGVEWDLSSYDQGETPGLDY